MTCYISLLLHTNRLDVGLSTLRKTAADVAELQIDLKHTMIRVEEKKAATDELLIEMGVQKEDAEKQQAAATIEVRSSFVRLILSYRLLVRVVEASE
jgi:hypothetical protein